MNAMNMSETAGHSQAQQVSDVTQLAQLSDEALLHELAAGRQDALGPLYSRFAPLIFSRAASALDATAAEEIVQDVLLAVWRAAATYDVSRGSARAWILQIARFRIINELRRRKRRPLSGYEDDEALLDSLPGAAPDPAEVVWRREHGDQVRSAVDSLPDGQRDALRLAYFADMTHEQVARTLQVPLGTAKTRIRSGLQKLRLSLAPLVAATVVALGGLAGLLLWKQHDSDTTRRREERALALVTASDSQALRMVAQPGAPADAHAVYRGRAGSTTAVITLSHMPRLAAGKVYQVWARHGEEWVSLTRAHVDAQGGALLIVEGAGAAGLPDALQVTIEPAAGSHQPEGPVVVAWPADAAPTVQSGY
ncbi:MAG: sigma-70 family RNA polymerase sigma factor [Dehalococcoidia bacterium]